MILLDYESCLWYAILDGVEKYDKNTSIHLADVRADYPLKRYANESSAMIVDGKRQWVTYEILVVDGEDFEQIGEAFEAAVNVNKLALATLWRRV